MQSSQVEERLGWARSDERAASMAGLVCLVTGATAGIGKATVVEFAQRGATVVLVARNAERGKETVETAISATGNEEIHLLVADLSVQRDIRTLCEDFSGRFDRLNVLLNDAAIVVKERMVTPDGFELMFATNQLAPFQLTLLLLPRMRTASPARVINVTAPSRTRPEFSDLQGERRFRATRAFGASKAANLLFTFALARRLAGTSVTVNAYHPGLVRTELMRSAAAPVRVLSGVLNALSGKAPEKAAGEIAELAVSPMFQGISGKLIHEGRIIRSPFENDTEMQERLFMACEELTGIRLAP